MKKPGNCRRVDGYKSGSRLSQGRGRVARGGRGWAVFFAASALTAGCAPANDADGLEHGERVSAIVGGELDVTHNAVVTLEGPERDCTATIIDVRDGHGYALGSAHCANQQDVVLLEGPDQASPAASYPVIDVRKHPAYIGNEHDLALIHFVGAGESTPHLPSLTKAQDDLQVGDTGLLIGFGKTREEQADETARHRRRIEVEVTALTDTVIRNEQLEGGACQGDSGGPLLIEAGGAEHIAGIIWRGDSACAEYGENVRVSYYVESFIEPTLAAAAPLSCRDCRMAIVAGRARCRVSLEACTDPACAEAQSCLEDCQTGLCARSCLEAPGADAFRPVAECACKACEEECREETVCRSLTPNVPVDPTPSGDAGGSGGAGPSPFLGRGGVSGDGTGAEAGRAGGVGMLPPVADDTHYKSSSSACSTVPFGPALPSWSWIMCALLATAKRIRYPREGGSA